MTANAEIPDLPLVDISGLGHPQPDTESMAAVSAACRDIGFMYVTGHGISPLLIDELRREVAAYFERPVEQKQKDSITRDNYRGYIPMGFFSAATEASPADLYEGYKLHRETRVSDPIRSDCDLYGPNRWPPHAEALQVCVAAYWAECDRVCGWILRALAPVLGISGDALVDNFRDPLSNMTLLHYPPQHEASNGFGIHPHKDTDALTILAPDPVGGLMVRRRSSDDWIHAKAPGDALIVNIGDLLELWSGGYFVSTPHKVVNSSGRDRISFPYFSVPRFDVVVRTLCAPQPGFSRPPVQVGDVSREVWRNNWPDKHRSNRAYDLGTLQD